MSSDTFPAHTAIKERLSQMRVCRSATAFQPCVCRIQMNSIEIDVKKITRPSVSNPTEKNLLTWSHLVPAITTFFLYDSFYFALKTTPPNFNDPCETSPNDEWSTSFFFGHRRLRTCNIFTRTSRTFRLIKPTAPKFIISQQTSYRSQIL